MNFFLYITSIENNINCFQNKVRSTKDVLQFLTKTQCALLCVDKLSNFFVKDTNDGRIIISSTNEVFDDLSTHNGVITENFENINCFFWMIIIDTNTDSIKIINDRFSSKEIYYHQSADSFLFFTDFRILFEKKRIVNKLALKCFLTDGYIPAPLTIIDEVYKLPYASCASITSMCLKVKKYFSFKKQNSIILNNKWMKYSDAKIFFEKTLKKSILRHCSSKKATVLLSSGVDSSYLTLLANEIYDDIDALTIGQNVGDDKYDESESAKLVAHLLCVNQTIKTIDRNFVLKSIEKSIEIFPELFGDTAQISVYAMAESGDASTDYICGEGADSLFFYNDDYFDKKKIKEKLVNELLSEPTLDNYIKKTNIDRDLYEWEVLMQALVHKTVAVFDYFNLHVKFPYLDNEMISFCNSLPINFVKTQNKKQMLKDCLNDRIPYESLNLPKRGAGVPIYKFIKDYKQIEASKLFDSEFINIQGIFNPTVLSDILMNFYNGTHINGQKMNGIVWRLYLFQKWYERYIV